MRVVYCDLVVMPREEPISARCEFLANVVPETIGHGHSLTSLIGLSDVRITKRELEFFREYVEQFTEKVAGLDIPAVEVTSIQSGIAVLCPIEDTLPVKFLLEREALPFERELLNRLVNFVLALSDPGGIGFS